MCIENEGLQYTKQQVKRLLEADAQRMEQPLQGNVQGQMQHLDLEQVKRDKTLIDHALRDIGQMNLTDTQQYRLRAIQGRNIAHLLLNQNQFEKDSPQMAQVKQQVAALEQTLDREWNEADAMNSIQELEGRYGVAIMSCEQYCECKHPRFRSGRERKQMVQETLAQLRTELAQIQTVKRMLTQGQLPEHVHQQRDLLVAAQEQQADQPMQAVQEEPAHEEAPAGIESLSYADFAAMIGTHNRGQIEFANGRLQIVNNHALSVSSGSETEENFQVREKLLILASDKMGELMTPDLSMQIKGLLGLKEDGERIAKPLSRKELYQVITEINLRSSRMARTLAEGEQAPESRQVIAKKVSSLIGGELGDWEVAYTPGEVEQQMKQSIRDLAAEASQQGVEMPRLSTHQMDVLVKGNLPLLRERLYESMNTVYDMVCRINQGNAVDVTTVSENRALISQLLSYEITKLTAQTPEARRIAEQEQKTYMAGMSFIVGGKTGLGDDFANSELAELSVKGADGLTQAVRETLPECEKWQAAPRRMQRGCDELVKLCNHLQTFNRLKERSLSQGLTEEESQQIKRIAAAIQQALQEDENGVVNEARDDMAFVAKELGRTRFAEGWESARRLVQEQKFSFEAAAEHIVTQIRPLQAARVNKPVSRQSDMERVSLHAKEQMEYLSQPAQQVFQILTLEKKASDLITKRADETSGEILALHRTLKLFAGGHTFREHVKLAGAEVELRRDESGALTIVEDGRPILLPFTAAMMLDRLEADMLEHEALYESAGIIDILRGLHAEKESAGSGGDMVRSRSKCLKLLQSRTGQPAAFFNNVSSRRLKDYALYLMLGVTTAEAVTEDVNKIENASLINGEEALALLKKGEQVRERESHVQIRQEQRRAQQEPVGPQWEKREEQVKDMLSDLIFSTQTWELDENERSTAAQIASAEEAHDEARIAKLRRTQSAERMRRVILNHKDAFYEVLRDPDLLKQMIIKLPLPGSKEGEMDGMKADVLHLVEQIKNMPQMELFRTFANGPLQQRVRQGFDAAIGAALHHPQAMEQLAQMDQQIDQIVETSMNSIQQTITDSVATVFRSDREEGQEQTKLRRETYGDTKEEQERWQKDSREELNRQIREAANGDRGQGLFIKNVFNHYFKNVPRMDQRAMLASALRSARPEEALEGLSEEEKEARLKKSMGNYLGGVLKGAGPLLQKMLQGMPLDSMPEELKGALKDMRSNLAPIPDAIVQAQLRSMIERSHGKVTDITVERALGAASVGQAFLCKFKGPDLPQEGKDVVVKLLRPDVRNHMMRERDIMIRCAKMTDHADDPDYLEMLEHTETLDEETIGGMEATYRGQLMRIEEELDLTIEARNVERGQLYDEGVQTVQAMKLNPLVEPTVNAMVVEKAPGTTLDKYMDETRKKLREQKDMFYERNEDGTEKRTAAGSPVLKSKPHANFAQTYRGLCDMYRELDKRQKYLLTLANKWVTEGVFGRGFYHGDLHAGNIMVDDDGMTIIDFGNATKLDHEQQCHVVKMMLAAGYGMMEDFRHSFHMLLQNTPEETYQEKREELGQMLKEVFAMGTEQDTGSRIAVILLKAQELGLELPPAIANFSQSQIRLQQTIEEINNLISEVKTTITELETTAIQSYELGNTYATMLMNSNKALVRDDILNYHLTDFTKEQFFKQLYEPTTDEQKEEFVNRCMAGITGTVKQEPQVPSYIRQMDNLMKIVTPEFIAIAKSSEDDIQEIEEKTRSSLNRQTNQIWKELDKVIDISNPEETRVLEQIKQDLRDCVQHPLADGFSETIDQIKTRMEQFTQARQQSQEAAKNTCKEQLYALWALNEQPDHSPEELEQKGQQLYDLILGQCLIRAKADNWLGATIEYFDQRMADTARDEIFDDESFMGREFREAYERFRMAKEQNSPEADEAQYQMECLYVQIQSHLMAGFMDAINHTISGEQRTTNPDTFFDVMADVIMTNKKAAANRLGIFYAMKVMFKQ